MSRSSRDYYQSTRDTTLPSIRDVMGDVLAQPARPGEPSRNRSIPVGPPARNTPSAPPMHHQFPPVQHSRGSESSHFRTESPSSRDYRMTSPSPPPSRSYHRDAYGYAHSGHSHSGYSQAGYAHSSASPARSASVNDYRMQSPSPRPASRATQRQDYTPRASSSRTHSYDVFVASDQGLVHKQSSTSDDFHQVTKEDVIASSTGKHVCAECQRRFEKLSTLKNHLTTHSGERPHECPECGKSFSVYTNMRRHQLIHRRPGTSG